MDQTAIENVEAGLFLEALHQRHGYDFRNYSRASMLRRLRRLAEKTGAPSLSAMIPSVLHDRAFLPEVVDALSVNVSEMFRDPGFFRVLREEVVPYLRTFPFVKIWHAGCSRGEEVYSLAIVLREEGFYERCTIFATDLNPVVLEQAKAGIFPVEAVRLHTANYQMAGGRAAFSDYYHASYGSVIMDSSLRQNVTFAPHNLATDGVFGEMHLVLCRNVLIYFDRTLQERVLALLADSLTHGGILALGGKESLGGQRARDTFAEFDRKWRVYKKVDPASAQAHRRAGPDGAPGEGA
ncbi:Chemotaxis protein methyltransferase [Fundidesulfovibrio magnetotacticus]|uniref:Chemotaxis protein methyltransferase n=1 Tax=Fundidesulfovibrio magnetotacticus TaxID=2730080 RepID=A0A6V8LX38_9BACT|nr:protein-glutamate O-methyltransferase CheR [Fundidesulfovibrio magnetotacticus]GFK94217.1 Chemotaxis protein methyltransferase [Fundidesulfovibrio magnetotacticus]